MKSNDNCHPELVSGAKDLFEFDKTHSSFVMGTDEAGRGPAAGGVFAAAVYFPEINDRVISELSILNDSKQLSKKKRESIYDFILNETINSIVCVEVEEIEKINILNASLKAMKLACEDVNKRIPTHSYLSNSGILVLVDGNKLIKDFKYPQKYVIKGDSKSASIAAASILAKVTRDRYMERLDEEFPQYGWAKNAGYLTKEHMEAIDQYGLCKYHRPSFLKKHFEKQMSLF